MDLSDFEEVVVPPRLESIPQDDILEAINESSLLKELTQAVREEDELEVGHIVCRMVWQYKNLHGN